MRKAYWDYFQSEHPESPCKVVYGMEKLPTKPHSNPLSQSIPTFETIYNGCCNVGIQAILHNDGMDIIERMKGLQLLD
jgi:hypothetical protein